MVAENEWQAIQAARTVKVTWSTSTATWPAMDDLYTAMWAMSPRTRRVMGQVGDVDAAFKSASRTVEARYEWPFQAHAMMGPGCAVVDVRDGGATVWSSTQHPHQLQRGIAELLGLPASAVHVIWVEGAGSYGRSGAEDVPGDAALLSQAVGRPVRVQWMRADDTAWDPKGPPVVMAVRAGPGRPRRGGGVGLHGARLFREAEFPQAPRTAGDMLAGQLTGLSANGVDVPTTFQENYAFPAKRKIGEIVPWTQDTSPLRTANLRAPSQPATTFGGESFVDEMAAALRVDPVEFRLRYLKDPRDIAVVRAAAQQAGWDSRPSPKSGVSRSGLAVGRGIAYAPRGGTRVATVVEVEVNQSTGEVRVPRVVVAHDCGLIINPDGLRGTIEANVIQSTSRALMEEVRFGPVRRDQRGLGDLSDPARAGCARQRRDRPHQSSGAAAGGRRGTRDGDDRACDRERDLRRDGGAAAHRAVHARAGQGRATAPRPARVLNATRARTCTTQEPGGFPGLLSEGATAEPAGSSGQARSSLNACFQLPPLTPASTHTRHIASR